MNNNTAEENGHLLSQKRVSKFFKEYMKRISLIIIAVIFTLFALTFLGCIKSDNQIKLFKIDRNILFQNTKIELKFDSKMYCKVFYRSGGEKFSINNAARGEELSVPSHYIKVNGKDVKDFNIDYDNLWFSDIKGEFGIGKQIVLHGTTAGHNGLNIKKILTVKMYNKYPNIAVAAAVYKNLNPTEELKIDRVFSETYRLNSTLAGETPNPFDFWLFQGSAYASGNDRIIKLNENYSSENHQGKKSRDFSGGNPVTNLWNKTMGMAVGHMETVIKPVNLPVAVQTDKNVLVGIVMKPENNIIPPGGEYQAIKTVILVHSGDFSNSLKIYSALMKKKECTEKNM